MNLNLRPEILQMIKMTSNNYQDSCTPTGCSKPTGCRIMTVEKLNLILEAHYCGKLVEEITFFNPILFFPMFL